MPPCLPWPQVFEKLLDDDGDMHNLSLTARALRERQELHVAQATAVRRGRGGGGERGTRGGGGAGRQACDGDWDGVGSTAPAVATSVLN